MQDCDILGNIEDETRWNNYTEICNLVYSINLYLEKHGVKLQLEVSRLYLSLLNDTYSIHQRIGDNLLEEIDSTINKLTSRDCLLYLKGMAKAFKIAIP